MLDAASPYLSYITTSYALTVVVLMGVLCIQLRQYRRVRRQLDLFREKP